MYLSTRSKHTKPASKSYKNFHRECTPKKHRFFKPNVNAFINVFEVDGSSMAASQPVALFLVAFGEKEQLLLIGWEQKWPMISKNIFAF